MYLALFIDYIGNGLEFECSLIVHSYNLCIIMYMHIHVRICVVWIIEPTVLYWRAIQKVADVAMGDFIVCDNCNVNTDVFDYVQDDPLARASLDRNTNAFGLRLLDLCKSTGFRICNGRMGTDRGIGEYTNLVPSVLCTTIVLNLIQKFLNENKRLYCVFVDFKKAFDCENRNALWLKMFNCGIRGKVLRIVKDMYENVKSSVKVLNTYSSFFE